MKNALIVGGTSGLGLALAQQMSSEGVHVMVTGRRSPQIQGISFRYLSLSPHANISKSFDEFVATLPHIDFFVYAAGFYQQGEIQDLQDEHIAEMNMVGLEAPQMLLARILRKQEDLHWFISITSTSQWTPRRDEPVYAGSKAGLAHFAHSVAEGDRVTNVMVVGPAGMATDFWRDKPGKDMSVMLDPDWVAKQIIDHMGACIKYMYIQILREPARVKIVEGQLQS